MGIEPTASLELGSTTKTTSAQTEQRYLVYSMGPKSQMFLCTNRRVLQLFFVCSGRL